MQTTQFYCSINQTFNLMVNW